MDTRIRELGTGILYAKNHRTYYVDACRNWEIVKGSVSFTSQDRKVAGSNQSMHTREDPKPREATQSDSSGCEELPEPSENRRNRHEHDQNGRIIGLEQINWGDNHEASRLLDVADIKDLSS